MAKALRAGEVCLALLVVLALAALGMLLGGFLARGQIAGESAPVQKAADASPAPYTGVLFPGLDGASITAVSIKTPESSFEFRRHDEDAVSVNGQRADGEVFRTLLSQIAQLPVRTRDAFPAQGGSELLTLVVSAGGQEHVARFYDDGGRGEEAFIVCGAQDAPKYQQTDGWRVGTLMMTCEGTRIQDERGNETPAE